MNPIQNHPVALRGAEVEASRLARRAAVATQDRAALDAWKNGGEQRHRGVDQRRHWKIKATQRAYPCATFVDTDGTEAGLRAKFSDPRPRLRRPMQPEGGLLHATRGKGEELRRRPKHWPWYIAAVAAPPRQWGTGSGRNAKGRNRMSTARRPGQNRTPLQREGHRAAVERMILTRPALTTRAIARELGVDVATAHRDVQAVRRRWAEQLSDDERRDLAARELAHLVEVRTEAWAAWERSLGERRRETVAEHTVVAAAHVEGQCKGGLTDGAAVRSPKRLPAATTTRSVEVVVEDGSGNPAYLRTVLETTKAIVALMGLAEPAKLRATGGVDVAAAVGGDLDFVAGVLAAMERSNLLDPAVLAALGVPKSLPDG